MYVLAQTATNPQDEIKWTEHMKQGIVLIEKENKLYWIIYIACPADNRVCYKDENKGERYHRFALKVN